MELDIRTLAFVATLSCFLMAISLAVLWWANREEKATLYWMAGAALLALGFFLIGLRHLVTPFLSVIVSNLAILAGYYLQYRGVQAFLGRATSLIPGLVLLVVIGTGFLYFTFISPDVAMRIFMISWAVGLWTLLAGISLAVEIRQRFSLPEAMTAFLLILFSVFMAVRGVYALFEGVIPDFMTAGTVHATSLIFILVLSIGLSIGYSVMVTVRLNRKLMHEIDVKNRFFSIMAHDLKSPFTGLLGPTELLQMQAPTISREDLAQQASSIHTSAMHAFRLVQNLLEWSRNQFDLETTHPEPLPCRELIDESIAPLQGVAERKRIAFAVRAGEERVLADRHMLTTVLRNLADNAVKFSEPGGTITLSARPVGDRVEVAVENRGLPIDPAIRNALFDISTKTSTRGSEGEMGSGLGLPLCRDLVLKNGGEIRIDDSWTEGARFVVTLPGAAGR